MPDPARFHCYHGCVLDFVFLIVVLAFFAVAAFYVRACAWVGESDRSAENGRGQ